MVDNDERKEGRRVGLELLLCTMKTSPAMMPSMHYALWTGLLNLVAGVSARYKPENGQNFHNNTSSMDFKIFTNLILSANLHLGFQAPNALVFLLPYSPSHEVFQKFLARRSWQQ